MAGKNIVTKIEGSKAWVWFAYGAGLFALGTIVWAGKETYDAFRASNALKVAEVNLQEAAGEEVIEDTEGEKSNCCGNK